VIEYYVKNIITIVGIILVIVIIIVLFLTTKKLTFLEGKLVINSTYIIINFSNINFIHYL